MKKILIFIFLFTISCSNNKVIKNHGISGLEVKKNKIELSKSNKNDVLKIIGKPSTISLFDDNIWFYIERTKINQSIFKLGKSKIEKNNILEISFNEYGIVENKKLYKIDDMNDIKVVKRRTTKSYDNSSPINKLLQSLEQKINAPKKSR